MAETVRAVTGLNLEYSRFNLPEKTNPFVATTISNPDCACFDNDSEYQFPLNWDTGPEALDVYFYPRNYSGSKQQIFTDSYINLNVALPTTPPSQNSFYTGFQGNTFTPFNYAPSYQESAVHNELTTITLFKTENVFQDYPDIPSKMITTQASGYFYAALEMTHFHISRKCWAGRGTLGNDPVIVIYTFSPNGISLILCYTNSAGSNSYIHSSDAAHGPHAVALPLPSPGTPFGIKPAFLGTEKYAWNDSYYYHLTMGSPVTSWSAYFDLPTNSNPFYNGFFGSNSYINTSTTNNGMASMTGSSGYIRDFCPSRSSAWLCSSGRPVKVRRKLPLTTSTPLRTLDPEEDVIRSFGTGIDSISTWEFDWLSMGTVPFYPGRTMDSYPVITFPDREEIPADDPFPFNSPWASTYDYEGFVGGKGVGQIYAISNFSTYNWPTWPNNSYPLTIVDASRGPRAFAYLGPCVSGFYGYGLANCTTTGVNFPCGDHLANYYYYNSLYNWWWTSNSSYPGYVFSSWSGSNLAVDAPNGSYGTWGTNPDYTGGNVIQLTLGEPYNETILDDGTSSYMTTVIEDIKSFTYDWEDWVIDYDRLQSLQNTFVANNPWCGSSTWIGGYVTYPMKKIGTVPVTRTRVIYKTTVHNLAGSIPSDWKVPISEEDENFNLTESPFSWYATPGVLAPVWDNSTTASIETISWAEAANLNGLNISVNSGIKYQVYPEGPTLETNCVNETGISFAKVTLDYPTYYVPFFLAGVRLQGGLRTPAELTTPTVRIFSDSTNDPEEYRASTFPRYYFQEYDPSAFLKVGTTKLKYTDKTTNQETYGYFYDYQNAVIINTGLPRASAIFQVVTEQPEHFQCEYKVAEFNDYFYYSALGSFRDANLFNALNIPEDLKTCSNNLAGFNSNYMASVFLFDKSRGEEQLRGSSSLLTWTVSPTLNTTNYLLPELTVKQRDLLYQIVSESNKVNGIGYSYLPQWMYVAGNVIEKFGYNMVVNPNTGQIGCNPNPAEIILGSSDVCDPLQILTQDDGFGNLTSYACGTSIKKVEPEYSVVPLRTILENQENFNNQVREKSIALQKRVSGHSYPITGKYQKPLSYTITPQTFPNGVTIQNCTLNYEELDITLPRKFIDTYAVFKSVYIGFVNTYSWINYGYYNFNYNPVYTASDLTKFTYEVDLPVWGKVIGRINNFYANTNSWSISNKYNSTNTNYFNNYSPYSTTYGIFQNPLDCTVLLTDFKANDRIVDLAGNYYGASKTSKWEIADIVAYGTSFLFWDAGNLAITEPQDPCLSLLDPSVGPAIPCQYPTVEIETLYPDGTNGYWGYYGMFNGAFAGVQLMPGNFKCYDCASGKMSDDVIINGPPLPNPNNTNDPSTVQDIQLCFRLYS